MTSSDEHRQEERTQRSQERNAVRMLAQQPLGNLDEPVHAARGLHDTCAGDGGDDDVDDVGRRSTGFQAEAKYEQRQTNA